MTVAQVSSRNIISHHVQANQTYYVDLSPLLDSGVTVSSISSVSTTDSAMTVGSASVVGTNTTVTDDRGQSVTLTANTAAQFTVSGGTVSTSEATVTVKFVKSDGGTDAVDCLIAVGGQAA